MFPYRWLHLAAFCLLLAPVTVSGQDDQPGEEKQAPAATPAAATAPAPVAATAPAATPAAVATNLVTLIMSDGRIEQAAAILAAQVGNGVTVYGKAAGAKVTIIAQDTPIESALDMMANPSGLVWWRDDKGDYGIGDREYYERNVLPTKVIQRVFRPNNIKASELDRAIKGLITPNVGSSVADDRTNKLIVNDLPQSLERIERFIREIDVQLVIRVFYIRHADVDDIAKKIETYKSDPGTIEVDVKTHQIIVTDLLSNIKKMELLIDILDVGPEIVIYDVNNIGIDGEDLEDLKTIIDGIRTQEDGLLFEVNDKQGVIILEDVPEVHERVEQVLAGFDQPVKQVLIQGEILSTKFERNFNVGLQKFATSENLFSALSQDAIGGQFFGGSGSKGVIPADGPFHLAKEIFPNFGLTGDTITGNYISQTVMAQYQAVFNDSSTRVLLQPRLLVKNQQPSKIFVGEEVPFLTTFFDDGSNNNNSSGRTTTTQSTVTSGLNFDVTPSISNSFLVELDLKIDNDEAKPEDIPDGPAGNTRRVVGRDRQNVETILQIPSGQTRMIGGLIRNRGSDGSAGVPFLASLPYIGALFGQKTSANTATNLLIFITPTVVEDNLPRNTTKDGRRGRLVTDYERVPGAYDLDADRKEPTEAHDPALDAPINPEDLLSSDASEEAETLRALHEKERIRLEKQDEGTAGNYRPSLGTGSATLNVGGQKAPAAPGGQPGPGAPRVVRPQQPAQPGQQPQTPVTRVDGEEREKGQQPPPAPPAETNFR